MKGKPYHHGNLRAALVEAATALIAERGPDGFTLREVARRARVSHAAPYRHFRDRDDLLAAVVEQGFDGLRRAVTRAKSSPASPLEALRRAGIAYVNYAVAHPARFQVMFRMELDAEKYPAARTAAEAAFESLVAAVAACQQSGDLPGSRPRVFATIAWSLVHGIAHLAIGGQFRFKSAKDLTRFTEAATAALFDGLKVEGRGTR